jgi:hypothetical protein
LFFRLKKTVRTFEDGPLKESSLTSIKRYLTLEPLRQSFRRPGQNELNKKG